MSKGCRFLLFWHHYYQVSLINFLYIWSIKRGEQTVQTEKVIADLLYFFVLLFTVIFMFSYLLTHFFMHYAPFYLMPLDSYDIIVNIVTT